MTMDTYLGADRSTGPGPVNASLGSEILTNGTFTGSATGWTLGSGWSYGSDKISHSSGTAEVTQSISVTANTLYLVSWNLGGTPAATSQARIYIDNTFCPGYSNMETEVATVNYSTYLAPSTANINFRIVPTNDFVATIDSVSLKAITTTAVAQFYMWDSVAGNLLTAFWGDYANRNFGIGSDCLKFKTSTAYDNTALGYKALNLVLTGFQNVAVGGYSQACTGASWNNTSLGYAALRYNNGGFCNTAVGCKALTNNDGGAYNVAVGNGALHNNTQGLANLALGTNACYGVLGNYNIGIGNNAIGSSSSDGTHNVSIGVESMRGLTSGKWNQAIGHDAMRYVTTGIGNNVSGHQVLMTMTTGSYNSGHGFQSLLNVTTGSYNTALGSESGNNITSGSYNICIGNAVQAVAATSSYQLNIGGLIYGDLQNGRLWMGATSGNANAILDLQSTTKPAMLPRMTTTQRNAVSSPTAGMEIYNSTTNKKNFYNGSAWEAVTSA